MNKYVHNMSKCRHTHTHQCSLPFSVVVVFGVVLRGIVVVVAVVVVIVDV